MKFSRSTSSMELGRKRKRFKILYDLVELIFILQKRLGSVRWRLTRPYYYQTTSSLHAAALNPTLLCGSPVNSVTDYLGTTDWKAALRWYIPFVPFSQSFCHIFGFSSWRTGSRKRFPIKVCPLTNSQWWDNLASRAGSFCPARYMDLDDDVYHIRVVRRELVPWCKVSFTKACVSVRGFAFRSLRYLDFDPIGWDWSSGIMPAVPDGPLTCTRLLLPM